MSKWRFDTARLRALGWHEAAIDDLPAVLAAMLTEPVTRWLPPDWQGPYTPQRAASWIVERDGEGPVLLVIDRASGGAVGLILLFEESAAEPDTVDVRLGYLLTEHAWGQGLGGELLGGLVECSRARGDVLSLSGGVAPENEASIRLLERHGFQRDPATDGEDLSYRLDIAH